MRTFASMNPAAVCVTLLMAAGITMFSGDPLQLGISCAAAILLYITQNKRNDVVFHLFVIGMALGFSLLNPLWNQHGTTVLLVINDRAITLEAIVYGMVSGVRLAAVLYWCRAFSDIMDSERIFYLLRHISPKLALLFSMALRNLVLFRVQYRNIQNAQRTLGLYRDGHLIDQVHGGIRVFSILLTWALENGIHTATSMTVRGYGSGKRTIYVTFRWQADDILLLLGSLLLDGGAILGFSISESWQYYPKITCAAHSIPLIFAQIAFALLAFYPSIHNGKERLLWSHLQSNI